MTTEALATTTPEDRPPTSPLKASDREAFELAQRKAKALASSSMVPSEYRENLPNVLVAMELAERIGCSVFAVMQNVDIIHGRPSMRSKFLIATVNACGRFTPLRFRWEGESNTPDFGCRAVAKDRESGEECVGALISWRLVRAEGWDKKKGSKWLTMPEQMFMYRAAAFWQRIYAPELSLGMHIQDEMQDAAGYSVSVVEHELGEGSLAEKLEARRAIPAEVVEPDHEHDEPRDEEPEPVAAEPAGDEAF